MRGRRVKAIRRSLHFVYEYALAHGSLLEPDLRRIYRTAKRDWKVYRKMPGVVR